MAGAEPSLVWCPSNVISAPTSASINIDLPHSVLRLKSSQGRLLASDQHARIYTTIILQDLGPTCAVRTLPTESG